MQAHTRGYDVLSERRDSNLPEIRLSDLSWAAHVGALATPVNAQRLRAAQAAPRTRPPAGLADHLGRLLARPLPPLLRRRPARATGCCLQALAAAEPLREEEDPYHQEPHAEPSGLFEPVQKREHQPLNFDDPRLAFQSKSTWQLLRNYGVLSMCQIKPVVRPAPPRHLQSAPCSRQPCAADEAMLLVLLVLRVPCSPARPAAWPWRQARC